MNQKENGAESNKMPNFTFNSDWRDKAAQRWLAPRWAAMRTAIAAPNIETINQAAVTNNVFKARVGRNS